jgi:cell division protein FtsX
MKNFLTQFFGILAIAAIAFIGAMIIVFIISVFIAGLVTVFHIK